MISKLNLTTKKDEISSQSWVNCKNGKLTLENQLATDLQWENQIVRYFKPPF